MQDRVYAAHRLHAAGAAREEELQLWVGQRRQPWRWLDMPLADQGTRRPWV